MSKKKSRGGMTWWRFFLEVGALVLIVTVMCLVSVQKLRTTADEEKNRYMQELSTSLMNSVNYRLESNLNILESIAIGYIRSMDLDNIDMDLLKERTELLQFVHVFIIDKTGMGTGLDGTRKDFSENEDVMSVFQGRKIITEPDDLHKSEDTPHSGLLFAVPIYSNNEIVGVLSACAAESWTEELSSESYYFGDVFFHIVRNNGDFVVESTSSYYQDILEEEKYVSDGNMFRFLEKNAVFYDDPVTAEEMETWAEENRTKKLSFRFEGEKIKRIVYLMPLEYSDLNLCVVTIENIAELRFNSLSFWSFAFNIIIVIFFAVLSIVLFIAYRKGYEVAYVDKITDGYSYARFEKEGMGVLRFAKPGEYTFLSVNIDKFKLINDIFGKEEGDKVLKFTYDMLRKHIKRDELLCRSGSDNFDLLIHSMETEKLIEWMDKLVQDIRSQIEKQKIYRERKYLISYSIGAYKIEETEFPFVLIRDRAVMARKIGKKSTVNHLLTYGFYSKVEQNRLRSEKEMENRMDGALKNGHFRVFLQPKVDLDTEKVVGAEALVRWQEPDWDMIPPDSFIPFFEKNGFIHKLDLYVFETVCQYLRKWIDSGIEPVRVSVNLSRYELEFEEFLQPYIELQKKYDISPELIELELTETMFNENPEVVVRAVEKIHEAGYFCSLDDFGSGYSSLNIIQHLYVDVLKLDKAFFRSRDCANEREQAVIREIVHMARALGMQVCAEGVETADQVKFLKSIHCNKAQGYLYSRPVDLEAFEKYALKKQNKE